MDDITIGIDSRKDAIALLSNVSDMLKSRGLALNLSKTAIWGSDEARHHFQIPQNMYLDSLEAIEPGSVEATHAEKELRKRWKKHFQDRSPKYWDKVAKRYITAFGRLQSKKLVKLVPKVYLGTL